MSETTVDIMKNDGVHQSTVNSVISPFYDLFEKSHQDVSSDWLQYVEYYDTNVNGPNNVTDYRIQVDERFNWFLLSKSYVNIQFKLTQPSGAAWAGGQNVALQNNGAGFFSRWELHLDNNLVEYVDYADICNTLQSLIYFDDNYSSTIARNQFWYPDNIDSINTDSTITPTVANHQTQFSNDAGATWTSVTDAQFQIHTDTGVNYLTFVGVGANTNRVRVDPHVVTGNGLSSLVENINYGQRKRQQLLNNSTMISVQIPLKNIFGVLKSMTSVTKGMKYGLRLTRNDDKNIIYAANPSITFIQKVSWYVPRIKPNISVLKSLEAKLMHSAKHFIPFVDCQTYRTNLITSAANNQLYQIRTKRRNPIKVYVAFQIDDPNNVNGFGTTIARISGLNAADQTQGRRVFDNIQLTSLRCVLNSTVQYPEYQYITSFNTGSYDYARVYNELMRASLKDHDIDQGSIINYDNYKSIFPIFAIDLSEKELVNVSPETALLDIYWSNTNIVNYYMWVLIESEREVEIAANNGLMTFVKSDV
jgi:hypothetical protein